MFTTSDRMSRINRNNDPVLFETAHCMPAISTPVAVNTTATIAATSRRETGPKPPGRLRLHLRNERPSRLPFLSDFLLRGPDRRLPNRELPKARGSYRTPDANSVRPDRRAEFPRTPPPIPTRERRILMTNEADAYGEGGDGEEPAAARGYALAQASAIAARVANQTPSRPRA